MTLTIGSWGFPALVTITVLCGLVVACGRMEPSRGGYGDIANGVLFLFYGSVSVIVSLIAWLVWAVLT